MTGRLPDRIVPTHSSEVFTQDTLPEALRRDHALAPGHWGVLAVLEGSLQFVDLETGVARRVSAAERVTIHPRVRHKVTIDGPVRCRIDFFREPPEVP